MSKCRCCGWSDRNSGSLQGGHPGQTEHLQPSRQMRPFSASNPCHIAGSASGLLSSMPLQACPHRDGLVGVAGQVEVDHQRGVRGIGRHAGGWDCSALGQLGASGCKGGSRGARHSWATVCRAVSHTKRQNAG